MAVEKYTYEAKKELFAREGEWIERTAPLCVNKLIPTRTRKEYYQANKEARKYYILPTIERHNLRHKRHQ